MGTEQGLDQVNFYSPQEIRRSLFMLEMQIENLKTMVGIQQRQIVELDRRLAREENREASDSRVEPEQQAPC